MSGCLETISDSGPDARSGIAPNRPSSYTRSQVQLGNENELGNEN